MKAFDVEGGYRPDVFDVCLSLVVVEKFGESLVWAGVLAHPGHHLLDAGPELSVFREHAVMQVPMQIWDFFQREMRALDDCQRLGWFPMNEFGAELDRKTIEVRVDASADPIARLEHDHLEIRSA